MRRPKSYKLRENRKRSNLNLPVLILLTGTFVSIVAIGSTIYLIQSNSTKDNKSKIRSQLEDTQKKISALPELERDIFTKCMEKTSGTAQDISRCQDSTQKSMHTLAQDLDNLKRELEGQL